MHIPSRIVTLPRNVARRASNQLHAYQHALRTALPAEKVLTRALDPGADVAGLLRAFRDLNRPHFFFTTNQASGIAHLLEGSVPGWTPRTVADADRILERRVRLLGADEIDLTAAAGAAGGNTLPWHVDMLSGYQWSPSKFYRQISVPYGRADIKVPWELSRCQHLLQLGMAWRITQNDQYAAEVVAQIEDWIAFNPAGYGVNWSCTMEVAIRAVNWLWSYHLIADAPQVSDQFLVRLLASFSAHGSHIASNIERYHHGITTNHTLADYVGLLFLGTLLPELRDAATWERIGRDGIEACMAFQVAADGASFENSIPYHRLVLEMFLASHVLVMGNGFPFSTAFQSSLERMCEFVMHYTRPDGLAPLVGDSDDGRLQILSQYFDWHPQDHRYLLGVAGTLFDRTDFRATAHNAPGVLEESAWLLGVNAAEALEAAEPSTAPLSSKAFSDSGRYVMRHHDHFALVCADAVGTAGLGNHKHNDIFSYELVVNRVPVAVDRGSYLYTSDAVWRDRFRATSAHSTVVVDGVEQNDLVEVFAVAAGVDVRTTRWLPGTDVDVFEGIHNAYERLAQPVLHRRKIAFIKDPFVWLVIDELLGAGEHSVASYVSMTPNARLRESRGVPEPCRSRLVAERGRWAGLLSIDRTLDPRPDEALIYDIETLVIAVVPVGRWDATPVDSWFAPRYGQRVSAPALCFSAVVEGGANVGYAIIAI